METAIQRQNWYRVQEAPRSQYPLQQFQHKRLEEQATGAIAAGAGLIGFGLIVLFFLNLLSPRR
jgi:hypothetical protein